MDSTILPSRPIVKHIFRKYDIRGFAGSEVTPELAYLLGRAFGTIIGKRAASEKTIALGRDNRLSSGELHAALCRGLNDTGCNIVDIGLVPSPVLNYAVVAWRLEGGINVTASHNMWDQNGFKLAVQDAYPFAEDDIQALLYEMEKQAFVSGKGNACLRDIKDDYLGTVSELAEIDRPLRIVIDAGNGVAGLFAPQLFRRLGCQVIELYCESDGTFPHHQPNPENPENMRHLREKVVACAADIGFAYDGDGDRLGVVDEKGERYDADRILILLARDLLSRHPGARVLMDVKSSQIVFDDICTCGGIPVIWKTGHSLIKRKMHEDGILLAGEYSGHFFTAEDYYPIDDAMLASCRIAGYLARSGLPLSQLLGIMPQRFSTASIELACPDIVKFAVVEEITRYFSASRQVLDIDGARISFDDGWALVRASNTSANITVRFEAVSSERLRQIIKAVYDSLRQYPEVNSGPLLV